MLTNHSSNQQNHVVFRVIEGFTIEVFILFPNQSRKYIKCLAGNYVHMCYPFLFHIGLGKKGKCNAVNALDRLCIKN